jgi:hypothetical protein
VATLKKLQGAQQRITGESNKNLTRQLDGKNGKVQFELY